MTTRGNAENLAAVVLDPDAPVPTTPREGIDEANRLAAWIAARFSADPDAYELSARVRVWLGDSAGAVECWEESLKLNAGYAHAYYGLGTVAARRGDHDQVPWSTEFRYF